MDDLLKRRIERRLEHLSNEHGYKVLDFVEFLESKYGDRSSQTSPIEKIADRVEDTLRAGRVSVSAIKGTRDVIDAAGKVMQNLADAGRTVVEELQSPRSDRDREDGSKDESKAEPKDDEKDDADPG